MWQVLLAAAVAGSTGLVAKHVFNTNADPVSDQTQNPFDHSKPQVPVASTLGSPPASSGCNDFGNGDGSHCQRQDGIFRFSSSEGASRSGSKSLRKKAVGAKKAGDRSGCAREETEVPRKSSRSFAVRLKRRTTTKNVAAKPGLSSSKENSIFGWGLGVGIMYMMSAGKVEISKLNTAMDETAKVVQELKTELCKRKSSPHLHSPGSASEVDGKSKKNRSKKTQSTKFGAGNRDPDDIKVSDLPVIDDGECTSSVLTEEPEPRVLEIDQLEAELESELQKLPWSITEASHQEEMKVNLGEFSQFDLGNVAQTDASAMGFHEAEGQSLDSYKFNGVVPAELDQKLCHLLIDQQENQIVELESELNLAQSKLQSKEAELQALKECVRRLTDFSLSTVSEDETAAHEEQEETLLVGMKRPTDSESCGHYVG
ncbi:uncharacterized protein LOC132161789 isoform X1 [Corylus avellana]|uniref:uncharacterized protein LOC132161789 isoform X1 n=1 Tax=Corylus avellana TaxID=13451 RepID=UPI00286AD69A|nr:uncharacterized protein LOC132161789 isoform X1 [Corylus avellana]